MNLQAIVLTLLSALGLVVAGWIGVWLVTALPSIFYRSKDVWFLDFMHGIPFYGFDPANDPTKVMHSPTMDLMTWVHFHFQIPVNFWLSFARDHTNSFIVLLTVTAATTVGSLQAWWAWRMPPNRVSAAIRSFAWMAGPVAVAAACSIVMLRGITNLTLFMGHSPLWVERQSALKVLKFSPSAEQARKWTPVTLAELEANGKLSPQTKVWMTNSKLEIMALRISQSSRALPEVVRTLVWAREIFPDGEIEEILVRDDTGSP
jgi:hypothetical protein